MSRAKTVLSRSPSGTSPLSIRWARPSTMAVLPTPGSPIRTGLFLRLAGQDLDDAADLGVPADDRVQPPGAPRRRPGRGRTSPAPRRPPRGSRTSPAGCRGPGERAEERRPGSRRAACSSRPAAVPDPSSSRATTRCSTDTYSSLSRLASRSAASSSAGQPLGDVTWPGSAPGPLTRGRRLELGLQVLTQPVRVGARPSQQPRDQPLALLEQRQQQVLAVHLGVAEPQRLGLGVVQGFLRLLRQSVQVHRTPLSGSVAPLRPLELSDPVEQVHHQAERRVVEGQPQRAAAGSGPSPALGGANNSRPAASRAISSSPSATSRRTSSGCTPVIRA